jgi:acetyltransferase-like isoleucine patch superfamily enzyme
MLVFKIVNGVRFRFNKLLTDVFYRPFCRDMGKKVVIIKPILINFHYLSFGSYVLIRNFARIEGVGQYLDQKFNPQIKFGDIVTVEQNLHLTCAESVFIGSYSSIGANVTITDINHSHADISLTLDRQPITVTPVYIGENCNIFNNSVILPGTILGKSCIVGANSVVPGKSYPDYCLIAGAPAKIIKRYNFDTQAWVKTDAAGNFI